MKIPESKVKQAKRQSLLQPRRVRIQFRPALLAALIGSALSANAQSYSMNWSKIAGGGGTSGGGTYQLNATIGQPDASGVMNGGNYSLTGGFWGLVSAVQTPGAPTLYISSSGNTVTVYWQNESGCTLQQNGNCPDRSGWTACPCSPTTSNGTNYVTMSCTGGNLFFRLRKQ